MMRRLTILDYISLDGIIQAPGAALAAGWGAITETFNASTKIAAPLRTGLPRLPAGDGARNVTFATNTN